MDNELCQTQSDTHLTSHQTKDNNPLDMSATHAIQTQFAAHIRNPQLTACPNDISHRRMQVYRDLFYKNIEGFISNGFPVLRTIFSDEHWHAMIRDFMTHHHCKTPYFPEIAEEFLEYLQLERKENDIDPPFLIELAHYEWVELALDIAQEELPDFIVPVGEDAQDAQHLKASIIEQIKTQSLSLSPTAWSLTYQWPVHRLSATFQPEQPPEGPTYLLVYRNRRDHVKFMEINPVTARLISLIKEPSTPKVPINGHQLLQQLQLELKSMVEPEAVYSGGLDTLFHLYEVDVLLISH